MCHFMFLSNIDGPRWIVMGIATKMALTVSGLINLSEPRMNESVCSSGCVRPNILADSLNILMLQREDRDGNKWNLDPDEAFRRRSLFYELLTYDSWQVRPASTVLASGFLVTPSCRGRASHLADRRRCRWPLSIASCPKHP